LFYGVTPFKDDNVYKLYQQILKSEVSFSKEVDVPESAKDLIRRLLIKNPEKRFGNRKGLYEILKHPFYRDIDIEKLVNKCVSSVNVSIYLLLIFLEQGDHCLIQWLSRIWTRILFIRLQGKRLNKLIILM
jgi:serine/threonine protein kinase